jgi:hypothetical protein
MNCFEQNMRSSNLPCNYSTNLFIADHVMDKIVGETNDDLIKHCKEKRDYPTMEMLSEFLTTQFQIANSKVSSVSNVKNDKNLNVSKVFVASSESICFICKGDHIVVYCPQFKAADDKIELLKKHKICVLCAKHKYIYGAPCKFKDNLKCVKCEGKHMNILCQRKTKTVTALSLAEKSEEVIALEIENQVNNNKTEFSSSSTILPTAVVNVLSCDSNKSLSLRALLDSCSQSSYITEEIVQQLKLKRKRVQVSSTGIGGVTTSKITSAVVFNILLSNEKIIKVKALVIKKIAKVPSTTQMKIEDWKKIKLADPFYYTPAFVPILLGANVLPIILKAGVIRQHNVLLQETIFGWTIMGNIEGRKNSNEIALLNIDPLQDEIDEDWNFIDPHVQTKKLNDFFNNERVIARLNKLENDLKNFWELPMITNSQVESEHEYCEKLFLQKHKIDENGVIFVPTPFKTEVDWPCDSYGSAFKCLMMMEEKFKKNEKLREASIKYMNDYLKMQHMKKVTTQCRDRSGKIYYVKWHAVWKDDKIRIVFNFSGKTANDVSLNDVIYSGPCIQAKLFDILIRNRFFPVIVTADVEKFYRQVRLLPEDSRHMRILWKMNGKIEEYEPTTISQGIICGAWQANRARVLVGSKVKDSKVKKVIMDSFYVDDLNVGFNDYQEAQDIIDKVDKALMKHHLPLLKFFSNDPRAIEKIDKSRHLITLKPDLLEPEKSISMLGVRYFPSCDSFHFKFTLKDKPATTKRQLSSYAATIFDPIGALGPITLYFKFILQKVVYQKLKWEDKVSEDIAKEFNEHFNHLPLLNSLKIARWTQTTSNDFHLIGFSDSCKKGYGCVIYVRAFVDDEYVVNQLTSKNHVVPAVSSEVVESQLTIPKLELIAIELLVDTMLEIQKAINLKPKCFAYSDSKVAIAWNFIFK